MNFPLRPLAIFVSVSMLWFSACKGMSYGMRPAPPMYPQAASSNQAKGDFDTTLGGGMDDDRVGTWIFVGIAVAAGVAASVLVPLYLSDKL